MSLRVASAAAMLALVPLSVSAEDLIGDTLVFTRSWPTPASPVTVWDPNQVSTTVAADSSDAIAWNAGGAPLTIDPGTDQIVFTFGSSTSYGSTGDSVFDGFVITGFSHDILSASILSETLPGTPELQVLGRQLNLDVSSTVAAGQTIVLSVSVVPEPGTWALMLGGVAALGGLARRRTAAA